MHDDLPAATGGVQPVKVFHLGIRHSRLEERQRGPVLSKEPILVEDRSRIC